MLNEYLEEDTLYEVIVSTDNSDSTINKGVFGVTLHDNLFVLKLYPNHTLSNIRKFNKFTIHFTNDALLLTNVVLGQADDITIQDDYRVACEVTGINLQDVTDHYGKNRITIITAKPEKITWNKKTIPLINRSTNKIIEILIDYTRYQYMNTTEKKNFHKKLEQTQTFLEKNANNKQKQAIRKIKEKVNPHD